MKSILITSLLIFANSALAFDRPESCERVAGQRHPDTSSAFTRPSDHGPTPRALRSRGHLSAVEVVCGAGPASGLSVPSV